MSALKMQAFVPKSRRAKFDFTLKIVDLNNVPLVSGSSFVKWHLPSSSAAEHRGKTEKVEIKNHQVQWDYEKTVVVRLTIDKAGMLQDSIVEFEVVQEYHAGARSERITLGTVKLNLAEYADEPEAMSDGMTRRYLMQNSKINSTLKIALIMKQIDGDKNFTTPVLSSAPIFGGIAGIIAGERREQDEDGFIPSAAMTRDQGEMQDIYRRTLEASWSAPGGELNADECIEDIFAGGDGFRNQPVLNKTLATNDSDSDETTRGNAHHRRHGSYGERLFGRPRAHFRTHSNTKTQDPFVDASSINEQQEHHGKHEVDEITVRDDLKSWTIPSNA